MIESIGFPLNPYLPTALLGLLNIKVGLNFSWALPACFLCHCFYMRLSVNGSSQRRDSEQNNISECLFAWNKVNTWLDQTTMTVASSALIRIRLGCDQLQSLTLCLCCYCALESQCVSIRNVDYLRRWSTLCHVSVMHQIWSSMGAMVIW